MKRAFDAYGLRSSLVSRTLMIATLLLVVPLLLLVCFLYFDESRIQKQNAQKRLILFADLSEHSLEQAIEQQRNKLQLIDRFFEMRSPTRQSLELLSQQMGASDLFYLEKNVEGYVCQYASDVGLLKKKFTPLVHQFFQGKSLTIDDGGKAFYLLSESHNGMGVWGCIFSLEEFEQFLGVKSQGKNQPAFSFLTEKNQVFFSTGSGLEGQILNFERRGKHSFFQSNKVDYSGVMRPIPQTDFSLLVSKRLKHEIDDLPYFLMKIVILMGGILIVGVIGALLLIVRLVKPMKQLCGVMVKVGGGDLAGRYQNDRWGFEINVLGTIFNETVASLLSQMKIAENERIEKGALKRELMLGQEVQSSILPRELPVYPGLEIGAHFVSAKEVGGDFYDFFQQKEQLMVSIADTSGKGIAACLYSLSLRSMLRSFAGLYSDLGLVIEKTNNLFCEDTGDSGIFVTAWVAFLDTKTGGLSYTNCGHYPALLQRKNGSWEKLSTSGTALGVIPFDGVDIQRTTLEEGDKLFLYTDGVVEAHNGSMEMFGEERLLEVLSDAQELEAQGTVQRVVEAVSTFSQGAAQHDDLTAVVVMR